MIGDFCMLYHVSGFVLCLVFPRGLALGADMIEIDIDILSCASESESNYMIENKSGQSGAKA